jgi:hypothetical protein
MVSVRLKVGFVGATIGLIVLGIFGFILGAMLGGAEQAEGKPITWVIGGVLGAIICAITGAGCGAILFLQAYAKIVAGQSLKVNDSGSPSPDGNNASSTQS